MRTFHDPSAGPGRAMRSPSRAARRSARPPKARANGGTVLHEYDAALKGYSARLSAAALADVRNDPSVAYVEADGVVRLDTTQSGATWGLDRSTSQACR
jgi:aqualysin 1